MDFHLTNYRKHSGHAHELWITVDQKRVFSASYCENMIEEAVLARRTGLQADGGTLDTKKVTDILNKREIHGASDVVFSLRTYLDLDAQVALTSTDPILRSLAMLDKRIGKRTLTALEVGDAEHSLIRTLYALRMDSLQ